MSESTNDYIELLKHTSKERKETQKQFLEAIKTQTEQQNLALKTLGDRIERRMDAMRNDIRSVTNRIFWTICFTLVVVASLAGVAVKFKSLQLTPSTQGITDEYSYKHKSVHIDPRIEESQDND
jgi:hypothetical protein